MKHKSMLRIIAVMLAIVLAMNPMWAVAADFGDVGSVAEPTASNYIHSTYASTTNTNGRVRVYFQIVGTGTMNSIGAVLIQIKDSTGTVQKTFNYKTTPGMMSYSAGTHMGNVYYDGSASTRYYAVVTFQASNNSGTDNSTFITGYG